MSFLSTIFILFLLIVLTSYWLLPQRRRPAWLLGASLFFLGSWAWQFTASLLIIGAANYLLARLLGKAEQKRSFILWLGIAFNLLTLLVYKYNDFYLPALKALLEQAGIAKGGALQFWMPLGLSFLALQMISYLVDVQRRQLQPETSWLKFLLYVFYFPKLLSGPIERARTFLPKLDQPQPLNGPNLARALGLIAAGLVRKALIADTLIALIPPDLFSNPLQYAAQLQVLWLAAYAFFLYNDFAGYSSLVRGISALFGIELSQNFNTPYFAQNFSGFWNRWHISLSAWLRDYIYFPLSRALRLRFPDSNHPLHILIPPLVTMAVSGLWHGFSLHMLLWGLLHGAYQVVERLLSLRAPKTLPGQQPRWKQTLATLAVFTFVTLAWIPFTMPLLTAKRYLAGLILPSHWQWPDFYWLQLILQGREPLVDLSALALPDPRLFLILIPAWLLDKAQAKDELYFLKWKPWSLAAACALLVVALFLLSFADQAALFVYQGF